MIGKTRAERKVAAALRAKLSLEQAWERIDYAEDEIAPAVLAVRELEKDNEVEITKGDLLALLVTGRLPIEAGPTDQDVGLGSTDGFAV